jgi:hypothetical protein
MPKALALVLSTLAVATAFAQGTSGSSATPQEPIRARPAVLILRVADVPGEPASRHWSVIEPRGLRDLPLASDRRAIQYADDGTPDLGPGYELVRRYQPDPQSNTQYYVYNVDFNNPMFADRWSQFQRAQRDDARQARAEGRNIRGWARRKQQLLEASGRLNWTKATPPAASTWHWPRWRSGMTPPPPRHCGVRWTCSPGWYR